MDNLPLQILKIARINYEDESQNIAFLDFFGENIYTFNIM